MMIRTTVVMKNIGPQINYVTLRSIIKETKGFHIGTYTKAIMISIQNFQKIAYQVRLTHFTPRRLAMVVMFLAS